MVVDSSAVLAILQNEPEIDAFTDAIAAATDPIISAATLFESSMVMLGRRGENGLQELDRLIRERPIAVVPLDGHHASLALDAFRRYGKGRHRAGLNLGDCFSYALSKSTGLPLLFKGNDFVHTDVKPAV
jgi:ribonuclease VapC